MTKKLKKPESEKLSSAIVEGMQEVKAFDIVVLDLRAIKSAVADFFVICSGGSDKQVDAIAQSIDKEVFKKMDENPWHTEGKSTKEWLILDYISVVAHVFRKDRRQFYSLERLWGDAVITEIEDEKPAKAPVKKAPVKKAAKKIATRKKIK
jgi:ribosome-associated protein